MDLAHSAYTSSVAIVGMSSLEPGVSSETKNLRAIAQVLKALGSQIGSGVRGCGKVQGFHEGWGYHLSLFCWAKTKPKGRKTTRYIIRLVVWIWICTGFFLVLVEGLHGSPPPSISPASHIQTTHRMEAARWPVTWVAQVFGLLRSYPWYPFCFKGFSGETRRTPVNYFGVPCFETSAGPGALYPFVHLRGETPRTRGFRLQRQEYSGGREETSHLSGSPVFFMKHPSSRNQGLVPKESNQCEEFEGRISTPI